MPVFISVFSTMIATNYPSYCSLVDIWYINCQKYQWLPVTLRMCFDWDTIECYHRVYLWADCMPRVETLIHRDICFSLKLWVNIDDIVSTIQSKCSHTFSLMIEMVEKNGYTNFFLVRLDREQLQPLLWQFFNGLLNHQESTIKLVQ